MNPLKRIYEGYRKDADEAFSGDYKQFPTWRRSILEAWFRPKAKVGGGRASMTHLHPEHDKLHLPPGVYIADWRKYRVEDHQILINHQKRCHAAGLHDPWLRNYAHTLYPCYLFNRSVTAAVTRQACWGLGAALVVFIAQKTYVHFYPITYAHTPEYIEKFGTGELH